MTGRAQRLVAGFEPLGLDELNREAALRDRLDLKYIVPWSTLEWLAGQLVDTHRVLEIDGRRVFSYETVYFDSPSLLSYRDHVQRRRKRYKTRSRRYVDSDRYLFEVKLKGGRGETVKRQLERDATLHEAVDPHALDFLQGVLGELYGRELTDRLQPTLRTDYRRLTLVSRAGGEKVTCDFDLVLRGADGATGRLTADHVIVESKAERRLGAVDRILRRAGVRPVECSKYCLGVAMTHEGVKTNGLGRLLRTYFQNAGPELVERPSLAASVAPRSDAGPGA